MDNKDGVIEQTSPDIAEIMSVEPVSEASVLDIAEAELGSVVAQSSTDDLQEEVVLTEEVMEDDIVPSPLEEVNQSEIEQLLFAESTPEEEPVPPHKNGALKQVLECMLFVSTEPLSAKQLGHMLDLEESVVEEGMAALEESLECNSGLQLMRVAGAYQLCTRPDFADYCAIILQPTKKKLSKAALETLAVVAYRQPCTVPEIEDVRGVSVGGVVQTLIERGLVKEAGKKQTPGRPNLYATTPEFLEYFGLNDISELPDIDMLAVEEIRALESQKELFTHPTYEPEATEEEPAEVGSGEA